jgi:phosphopantetheinyl transferase
MVEHDERGGPYLRALAAPGGAGLPAISIAHAEGVAVALAVRGAGASPGIAVAPIVACSAEFEASALLDAERALLDRVAGPNRDEWLARLSCAKRAVAKATGLGGAACVEVVDADPERGELRVAPGPGASRGAPVPVVSSRYENFIWAWTLGMRAGS